ncbi:MAG: TetR/AcrR family transcriptional regulator [Acidimicrobiia bacterium]
MADERAGSGNIGRTLQLLWDPESSSGRGPRRSLRVAAIVDMAVEIADERGLAAVSIRSVAAELGVGAMTLYRYIPSKAELLDLMLDRVNQPELDRLPTGWRPAMEAVGRELWRLYTTHRWLPLVDQARPVLGPNAVRSLDLVMGALHGSGLTDQEKVSLMVTIDSFTTTLARTANAMATAEERTGVTHQEFWSSQEAALVSAMETGRYPHMAGLSDDAFAGSNEEHAEFGLRRILDGVQSLLDARTGEPPTGGNPPRS